MQQQAPAKKKKKIKVPRVVNGVDTLVEIEVDDDGSVAWGPNDKHTLLNKRPPGILYGRVLRSPHAHARVVKVDASAARRIPGVRAVVGATDEEVVEGSNRAADVAEKQNRTDVGGAKPAKRET